MKTKTQLRALCGGLCVALATTFLTGCSTVTAILPVSQTATQSPWEDYTDAKTSFERIRVGKTSTAELVRLGFDPNTLPNTRVLNYVDVVNLFGASFKLQDLPAGVRKCVSARDTCQGYVIRAQNIKNKREGNIAVDLLGFGKKTRTTGWEFSVSLVLVGDTVTYKLWNGTPTLESTTTDSNPLGPMQNMAGAIPKPW
jgi:hypothetical protein